MISKFGFKASNGFGSRDAGIQGFDVERNEDVVMIKGYFVNLVYEIGGITHRMGVGFG